MKIAYVMRVAHSRPTSAVSVSALPHAPYGVFSHSQAFGAGSLRQVRLGLPRFQRGTKVSRFTKVPFCFRKSSFEGPANLFFASVPQSTSRFKVARVVRMPQLLKDNKRASALGVKTFLQLCTQENMVRANTLASGIAALAFVQAHVLGAVAGTENDSEIARTGPRMSSADRENGKTFGTNLERVASPLRLQVDSAHDRRALYLFIKLLDRVALGYDALVQAQFLPDSYGSPPTEGPLRAYFCRSARERDCPRFLGGPTGARSVLRSIEASRYLCSLGAPFAIGGL